MNAINWDVQKLYLDTATMGRMSPSACAATNDLNRLASSAGCSPKIGRLVTEGFGSLSCRDQELFQSLACWRGMASFQSKLKKLVSLEQCLPVYLFSDPSFRLRLALECLLKNCKRILITDLLWTKYEERIREAENEGVKIVTCCLRPSLEGTAGGADLIRKQIVSMFQQNRCDGMLISHVTHMGCVMPVSEIVSQVREFKDGAFVVIDGAQALGHVPVDVRQLDCDLYLTCTQKWLGSYIPLRVVYGCRLETVDLVRSTIQQMVRHEQGDALNEFCSLAAKGCYKRFGEAISLASLFAACGAIYDYDNQFESSEQKLLILGDNGKKVRSVLQEKYAPMYRFGDEMKCGILSVKGGKNTKLLMERLVTNGISAKNFAENIRLSMPSQPISHDQIRLIEDAMLVD